MDLCVCDHSCIAFTRLAHIPKQLRSILLPSIHLPLISQLINTLKIYWIISRGTLLPFTDACEQDRRPRSGSVTTFVLCRANAVRLNIIARHIINIFFNGIPHYLSLLDSVMQRQRIFPLCISSTVRIGLWFYWMWHIVCLCPQTTPPTKIT